MSGDVVTSYPGHDIVDSWLVTPTVISERIAREPWLGPNNFGSKWDRGDRAARERKKNRLDYPFDAAISARSLPSLYTYLVQGRIPRIPDLKFDHGFFNAFEVSFFFFRHTISGSFSILSFKMFRWLYIKESTLIWFYCPLNNISEYYKLQKAF